MLRSLGYSVFLLVAALTCAQTQLETPCRVSETFLTPLRQAREASQRREYPVAVQHYREALTACADDRNVLLELSEALLATRSFEQAIAIARSYVAAEPNSVQGRLVLANAYLMAQRLVEARDEAAASLRISSRLPQAMKVKSNAEYLLGQFEDARNTLIELLDSQPNDADAAYMLGRMYYQEGYTEQAIGQFQRVLKISPSFYKAWDNLGLCYQALGDNDAAIRHFLTAIKLVETDHPEYDWAYANLSDLLFKNGDVEKAYAAASKAANRNAYSARNFYLGGRALHALGKTDLAVNWLQRSTALDPNYAEPHYLLARIYHKLGDTGKADAARQKFLELKARTPTKRR
jgi:tetratricopeptide (TPR) repeat protein